MRLARLAHQQRFICTRFARHHIGCVLEVDMHMLLASLGVACLLPTQ
jgi:hypothetical protein